MKFDTSTSDKFVCVRCGHQQSYFAFKEAVEGGEPCVRCREAKKPRSYYQVHYGPIGWGPICETREEAERWIEDENDGKGRVIVQRFSPEYVESLGEFQGW